MKAFYHFMHLDTQTILSNKRSRPSDNEELLYVMAYMQQRCTTAVLYALYFALQRLSSSSLHCPSYLKCHFSEMTTRG